MKNKKNELPGINKKFPDLSNFIRSESEVKIIKASLSVGRRYNSNPQVARELIRVIENSNKKSTLKEVLYLAGKSSGIKITFSGGKLESKKGIRIGKKLASRKIMIQNEAQATPPKVKRPRPKKEEEQKDENDS